MPGIEITRKLETFSEGEQQRIAVARLLIELMIEPMKKILLLDEATSALDANTAKAMISNIIKEFSKTHMVCIISHTENIIDYADLEHILRADDMCITQIK